MASWYAARYAGSGALSALCPWDIRADRGLSAGGSYLVSWEYQRNLLSTPGVPSFLEDLYQGRFRWDLLQPFPEQEMADRHAGDEVIRDLGSLLRTVDPAWVDLNRRLPEGFLDELKARRFHRLRLPREIGGLGLSEYNTFRLLEAASSWSVPVALVMAIETAVGLAPYLSRLREGPLRDYLLGRLADGVMSAAADTEPSGAANFTRDTTAVPARGGYLINGEKIHIGNAPIADVFSVTATLRENGRQEPRLFFVEAGSPGFRVESSHEFMGIKGFPNGRLLLDDVYVPRERLFQEDRVDVEYQITPQSTRMLTIGRLYLITAPSLALARQCLRWCRDFIGRRRVNGRPLAGYLEIQRLVSLSLAEVFAIESVAQWCLLSDRARRPVSTSLEQISAKNIGSVTAWRIIDRTMSLLAGEGFETAASKQARHAPPLPLERAFRDARNFRISGGVDFQIDNWAACMSIFSYYYPHPTALVAAGPAEASLPSAGTARLSAANHDHLAFVAAQVRRLGEECRRLSRLYPDSSELFAQEDKMIRLSEIANELLTMALVLARAAHLARQDRDEAQPLADVYCGAARHRVAALWQQLAQAVGPAASEMAAEWMSGKKLEFLLGDTLPDQASIQETYRRLSRQEAHSATGTHGDCAG
jgi:alkylation response protein AidB-like acyl-CoA dehydrogenase